MIGTVTVAWMLLDKNSNLILLKVINSAKRV